MTTALDSRDARLGAEAAGRSAAAIAAAAENAAKPGTATTEMRVTLGAIAFAALVGLLKAAAVIPGPWQIPAALGLGAIGSAAAYSSGRGKVKAAALAAAASSVSGAVLLPTPNAD